MHGKMKVFFFLNVYILRLPMQSKTVDQQSLEPCFFLCLNYEALRPGRGDRFVLLRNIIITGNPGTGKTTFARLLARFFHTYGVLPKDSFVEKNGPMGFGWGSGKREAQVFIFYTQLVGWIVQ